MKQERFWVCARGREKSWGSFQRGKRVLEEVFKRWSRERTETEKGVCVEWRCLRERVRERRGFGNVERKRGEEGEELMMAVICTHLGMVKSQKGKRRYKSEVVVSCVLLCCVVCLLGFRGLLALRHALLLFLLSFFTLFYLSKSRMAARRFLLAFRSQPVVFLKSCRCCN